MTNAWTFSDYLLQWIWLGIIVVCAAVYCVRKFFGLSKGKGTADEACGGCLLKDNCHKDMSKCDNRRDRDNGSSGPTCGCC